MPRPGLKRLFVVPGSTPHVISRRCFSQHRCLVNFDPNNVCLACPEFGSVPLVLHSGHLILSLVNPSNTLDQYTVMIDYQNSSSSFVNSVQKRDEQTMGSLQSRDQVADKRAEPDEKRTANSSIIRCRSDPLHEFVVPLGDPNEEITEQRQDGLHDWYTCRDDQCSVKSASGLSQRRSSNNICSCLRRHSVSVKTSSQISTPC